MLCVRTPDRAQINALPAATSDGTGEMVAIGFVDELARSGRQVVTAGDLELLVVFHRGRFTVVVNRCPHLGAPLAKARIGRGTLTCPVHSYRYSLTDGVRMRAPRSRGARNGRLTLIPTRVVDGLLYGALDRARPAEA